jgi:hypothetical protein
MTDTLGSSGLVSQRGQINIYMQRVKQLSNYIQVFSSGERKSAIFHSLCPSSNYSKTAHPTIQENQE